MANARYVSLLGLGFGDCGKGLFTDALTRTLGAHTIVRFNGGAQAGHNVVLPDGRHHTFSQFGSGSFVDATVTVLASTVVVHPSAILVEAQALQRVGVTRAMARLMIDGACKVTTPFHQAAGRLREHLRGASAHGTCGVGVGETVAFALANPGHELTYGELQSLGTAHEKLLCIQQMLRADIAPLIAAPFTEQTMVDEWDLLTDGSVAERWLNQIAPVVRTAKPQSKDAIAKQLCRSGTVIFEGAQGVLLDEWRGFHPHTAWSTISTDAVESVLTELGVAANVEHYGVLRSYLTRHGIGPFPTHDLALNVLAEPHNSAANWQGEFRRGHPDAVLLRYALDCVGSLDGLLISHLDAFSRVGALRWCEAYSNAERLDLGAAQDLSHQATLTALLDRAEPRYATTPIAGSDDLLERIGATSRLPVRWVSDGNTYESVSARIRR